MKRFYLIFKFIFLLGFFFSCANSAKNDANLETMSDAMLSARSLLVKPDSLRSIEEKELLLQLESAFYEYFAFENDRFVVSISEEEWKKKNLPEVWYKILMQDIDDFNNAFEKMDAEELLMHKESFREAAEEYFARTKSQQPD